MAQQGVSLSSTYLALSSPFPYAVILLAVQKLFPLRCLHSLPAGRFFVFFLLSCRVALNNESLRNALLLSFSSLSLILSVAFALLPGQPVTAERLQELGNESLPLAKLQGVPPPPEILTRTAAMPPQYQVRQLAPI